MKGHKNPKSIPCGYCGGRARFCPSSAHRYGGRDYGPIYECKPCDAFVGVHRETNEPLGTVADKPTREARNRAHAAFDPIWKQKTMSRQDAYAWLSRKLNLPGDKCHIGMFTIKQCGEVVKAVKSLAQGQLELF